MTLTLRTSIKIKLALTALVVCANSASAFTVEEYYSIPDAERGRAFSWLINGVLQEAFSTAPESQRRCIIELFGNLNENGSSVGTDLVIAAFHDARDIDPSAYSAPNIIAGVMANECPLAD